MVKYLYLLLLPLLACTATGCDNEKDSPTEPAILMKYLAGSWQIDPSTPTTVYNIYPDDSTLPAAGSVGYSGSLTTLFLTEEGYPLYDKEYSWKIVGFEDVYYPLIELVWQADLDAIDDDAPATRFYYRIEELTPTTMRWHINSIAGTETLTFTRRPSPQD